MNQEQVKEFTIPQLTAYLQELNKYDEEYTVGGTLIHLKNNVAADYIRLRPNGIDCVESRGDELPVLMKKIGHKWGQEYIKIIR